MASFSLGMLEALEDGRRRRCLNGLCGIFRRSFWRRFSLDWRCRMEFQEVEKNLVGVNAGEERTFCQGLAKKI